MYSAVVTITETNSTRYSRVLLKFISSVAWEMFSNPMNAQGEITAMRTIWDREELPGT